MTQIKTAELTGAALDWAVATLEAPVGCIVVISNSLDIQIFKGHEKPHKVTYSEPLKYSTDWAQGGPIIECEINKLWRNMGGTYGAQIKYRIPYYSPTYDADIGADAFINNHGTTPLIAAMRCYVASKLGDTVEIPEELL